MDIKRLSSAILGFPIVVLILISGNKYIIDIAFTIITLLGLYEYFNAVSKECKPVRWLGYIFTLLIALMHIIPMDIYLKVLLISMPTLLLGLFLVVVVTDMKINFKDICYTLFGIIYIVMFTGFIPFLYGGENGKYLVWYLIITSWGTDIFAYLIGKKFGKHKFSKVSPKKSIEGCIAGVIGAVVLTYIYTYAVNTIFGLNFSYNYLLIVGAVLSIISQLGDFAASSIKRYVDIKDFSNLIPGHGGMMDRIDSLIFIAPFAYILLGLL